MLIMVQIWQLGGYNGNENTLINELMTTVTITILIIIVM